MVEEVAIDVEEAMVVVDAVQVEAMVPAATMEAAGGGGRGCAVQHTCTFSTARRGW